MQNYHVHIDFAHRTFRWDSEANIKAHVHCIIVGFSVKSSEEKKRLYASDRVQCVDNINGYLLDAPDIFTERRTKPICSVPQVKRGNQPTDDGNLILTAEQRDELVAKEPAVGKYIRPYRMGKDFINRKPRFCIWLLGANPAEIKKCLDVMKRIQNVREFRLLSKKAATRIKADTPMLFDEIHECKTNYIAIPKISSENRRYIPMHYLKAEVVAGDTLFMVSEISLFHLGILTSNVHMAWMRAVCGRLKSDYRYSNTVVYNNFPWPELTDKQKVQIGQTAQAILNARALYPDASLADLYDETTMPPELRKAHRQNDRAVMEAYGFSIKISESECVAALMKLYQSLTEQEK